MQQILWFYWELCMLRATPSSLPRTTQFFSFVLALYLLAALLSVALTRTQLGPVEVAATVVIGIGVEGICTWLLLAFKSVQQRFLPVMAALLGCRCFIMLMLLPFNFMFKHVDNETVGFFAETISWLFLGWWLAVAGYIFHRAMNIGVFQGAALAFMMELLTVLTTFYLLPSNQATT